MASTRPDAKEWQRCLNGSERLSDSPPPPDPPSEGILGFGEDDWVLVECDTVDPMAAVQDEKAAAQAAKEAEAKRKQAAKAAKAKREQEKREAKANRALGIAMCQCCGVLVPATLYCSACNSGKVTGQGTCGLCKCNSDPLRELDLQQVRVLYKCVYNAVEPMKPSDLRNKWVIFRDNIRAIIDEFDRKTTTLVALCYAKVRAERSIKRSCKNCNARGEDCGDH